MNPPASYALALVVAASLLAAEGASAATPATGASPVHGAFGNTISETYPDGRHAEIWLKSDGTYTGEGRRHDMSNGTWTATSSQLCFKQSHPFVFGAHFCTPIPKVGIDQPWQAKAPTGEAITVKVVPGHVVPS